MSARPHAGGTALGLLALCLGAPGWACSPSVSTDPSIIEVAPVAGPVSESAGGTTVTATAEGTVTLSVAAVAQPTTGIDRDPARRARTEPVPWKRGRPQPFPTALDRDRARLVALEARSERRAYDGAPPVIPHSAVFGAGTNTCLDCHTEGMTLGARVAHPMSHPPFSNCLQCHVETSNRQFPPQAEVQTSFAGLASPGPGARQSALAPPQMPHGIAMRGQCLSCHGEFGHEGLRTTHPERANCVQCHAVQSRAQ